MAIDGGFSRRLADQPLDTPAGTRSADGRPEDTKKAEPQVVIDPTDQAQRQINALIKQLSPHDEIGVYLVANPSTANNFALSKLLDGTCTLDNGQRYVPPEETQGEWVDLGSLQAHWALNLAGYHGFTVGARDVDTLVARDSNDAHGAAAHAIIKDKTILDEEQIDHLLESGTENGIRAVSISHQVAGYELTDQQSEIIDTIARAGDSDPRSPVANNIMLRQLDSAQQVVAQINPGSIDR